jgi:hypothetical protein
VIKVRFATSPDLLIPGLKVQLKRAVQTLIPGIKKAAFRYVQTIFYNKYKLAKLVNL